VSRARVRITREQYEVLSDTLSKERHRSVILRAYTKDKGKSTSDIDRKIDVLDEMQDEVCRTAQEMGWRSA
jgi:hypothetical protein